MPGCDGTGVTKRSYPHPRSGAVAGRSYPTLKVRGSGQECQNAMVQELPRGATPCLRSGAAARRSNPTSKELGLEELFYVQGQRGQQWGDTPRPR